MSLCRNMRSEIGEHHVLKSQLVLQATHGEFYSIALPCNEIIQTDYDAMPCHNAFFTCKR